MEVHLLQLNVTQLWPTNGCISRTVSWRGMMGSDTTSHALWAMCRSNFYCGLCWMTNYKKMTGMPSWSVATLAHASDKADQILRVQCSCEAFVLLTSPPQVPT